MLSYLFFSLNKQYNYRHPEFEFLSLQPLAAQLTELNSQWEPAAIVKDSY